MKKITLLLIIVFFVSTAHEAQENFEGSIRFKMTQDGTDNYMTYSTNGSELRMDIEAEETVSIIFKDDKILMLMPSQKMFMEYPKSMMDILTQQGSEGEEDELNAETLDNFRTGEKKDILGYECEKWLYKDKQGTAEIWATDKLGNFYFAKNPMQPGGSNMLGIFNDSNLFPLAVKVADTDGNHSFIFEAVEISKASVPESTFNAPEGYSKMTMPGM